MRNIKVKLIQIKVLIAPIVMKSSGLPLKTANNQRLNINTLKFVGNYIKCCFLQHTRTTCIIYISRKMEEWWPSLILAYKRHVRIRKKSRNEHILGERVVLRISL